MTAKQQQKIEEIHNKYISLKPLLTERSRRLWAATEVNAYGWGGATIVNAATGISHPTIRKGRQDIETPPSIDNNAVRRPGGGRKKT
jgi:hypothetical protein